ncbi:ATP-binding protein [Vibrio sp. SCSIO 43137]|uniref:ATP-binding protein n=1 Tax=Vibrio sp. SCSIO 43137 TaxID=3021011 RepID=UPI0023079AAF|nr:sensor histidine kinase [Vibrio sp. SCSIO 43137]WCE30393.1 sensor histidine kinase [Vibrio sp. SCSIO 43137]
MKLKSYLAITTIATSSFIVIVVTSAILFLLKTSHQESFQARGLELARVLAHNPVIINAVEAKNNGQPYALQDYIEGIRSSTDASYIVVVDKNAMRLSHPTPDKLGKHFIGDDIFPALEQGLEYSSVASGSLGEAIRNFSPILLNGEVIGAICIGYLSVKTSSILLKEFSDIGLIVGSVYLLGMAAIVAFVFKIRKTFLDFEPEFIVNKFREHEMVFDSIRDAIIAIDSNMAITTINNSAIKLLSMGTLNRYDYIKHELSDYSIPLSHLVLTSNGMFHQGDFSIGKLKYRAHIYPINTFKGLTGYVIVFFANLNRDELEREVNDLKNYTGILRSKTHEYSNKLNVISGLLQTGKYRESIEYIQQETDKYQSVLRNIVMSVTDSAVASLLLAKFNKASELGVKYSIDPDSHLSAYHKNASEKLITIIGNIVDNALLASWQNRQQRKPEISVYISDRSSHIILEVQDSGAGIEEKLSAHILEFGVSSKDNDEHSGIGLYLVKQLVDYFHGSIDWERTEKQTTLFSIYLNKDEVENDR